MKKVLIILSAIFIAIQFNYAQDNLDSEKLDKYLQLLEENDKMMGAIALYKENKFVYKNFLGKASIEQNIPISEKSIFRVGSISKTFTSTMIFQLIEEGKLSLDTRLAYFYPEIKNADKITISHMLGHRSGIYSLTDDPEYNNYFTKPKSKSEIVAMIESYDPVFEPDERSAYSNSNYVLLGFIIENLTDSNYSEQLKSRITEKLNLKNTYYGNKIDLEENEVESFRYVDNSWTIAEETDMSIPHGAGAVVSTVEDLCIFISALFEEKLISASSLNEMKTIVDGYGKGIFQIPFNEKSAFGHNGGIDGFLSMLAYFPEEKTAYAFTSNGMNYNMNNIAIGVLSINFGVPFELPDLSAKSIDNKELDLARYEGNYSSSDLPLKIKIFQQDGQLYGQATGQGAFPLTPFSNTEFKFEQAGIVIKFKEVSEGSYTEFVLHQGGGKFSYTKD